jgi:hypothetical protein
VQQARENWLSGRPGSCPRGEPGELAEPAVTRCRGTADDPGFTDPGDIGGAVAVRVADLVVRAAEHVGQAHQLDEAMFCVRSPARPGARPGFPLGRRDSPLRRNDRKIESYPSEVEPAHQDGRAMTWFPWTVNHIETAWIINRTGWEFR